MLKVLFDRKVYYPLFIAAVPLLATVCSVLTAVAAALISVITITLSALIISALKGFLNKTTAPFAQLIISVGIVGMLTIPLSLILPDEVEALGIYLPLLAVIAPIVTDYGRYLESSVGKAALDALIPAAGHGVLIIICGIIREVIGLGSILGIDLYTKWLAPVAFFATPAGGLLLLGLLLIAYNVIVKHFTVKEDK